MITLLVIFAVAVLWALVCLVLHELAAMIDVRRQLYLAQVRYENERARGNG